MRDRAMVRAAERYGDVTASVPAGLGGTVDPSTLPVASPWGSSDQLHRLIAEDVFGNRMPPVNTRAAAMRIPAIARARNLLVATICGHPLVSLTGDTPDLVQPSWLYRTDDGASPQLRLAWTVDDLIFYGWSCWWRTRAADTGFPLTGRRINQGDWYIDVDMRPVVNGAPVDPADVIVIPGLHEGILSYGLDTLSDTRALYASVRKRIANPVPQVELHQIGGRELTNPEIDTLVDRWAQARRGENGGVAFTSKDIEARPHGAGAEELLIDARNAASLDLARIVGVAASRIDATVDKASLTYETTTGRNQEFVDFDLDLYTTPIEARLSMDDCVPRGHRVAFDLGNLTNPAPAPTGPTLQD